MTMQDTKQEYNLKRVDFNGTNVPIVCQNDNGPCPLLAICNTLLLKCLIDLPKSLKTVEESRLLSMLAGYILDRHSAVTCENVQRNLHDTIGLLPKLTTGIDVNLKFHGTDAFEYTAECGVFDLVGINLLHGWVVDSQDIPTAQAFGSKSYNDVLDVLVSAVGDGQLADDPLVSARSLPDLLSSLRASSSLRTQVTEGTNLAVGSQIMSESTIPPAGDLTHKTLTQEATGTGGEDVAAPLVALAEPESPGTQDADTELAEAVALSLMLTPIAPPPSDVVASDEAAAATQSAVPHTEAAVPLTEVAVEQDEADIHDVLEGCIAHVVERDEEGVAQEASAVCEGLESGAAAGHSGASVFSTDVETDDEALLQSGSARAVQPTSLDGNDVVLLSRVDPGTSAFADVAGPSGRQAGDTASGSGTKGGQSAEQVRLIQRFITDNMSQLTVAGLCMLHEVMKEGELAVFFRNNHFSTLLKRDRSLYILVTDQGYHLESGVVWEKLDNVEGDTTFYSSDFVTYNQHVANRKAETDAYLARVALSEQVEAAASNPQSGQGLLQDFPVANASAHNAGATGDSMQADHDLALALYLQQEEQQRVQDEERAQRNAAPHVSPPNSQQLQQRGQGEAWSWSGRPAEAPAQSRTHPPATLPPTRSGLASIGNAASRLGTRFSGRHGSGQPTDNAKKSDCTIM